MSELIAVHVQTLRAGHFGGELVNVDVYEMCVGLNVNDLRGFEIRSSTGYRAVFPEAHIDCDRAAQYGICLKPAGHGNCRECHGTHHLYQVLAVARAVVKTYGSAKQGRTNPSVGRLRGHTGFTGTRVPPVGVYEWNRGQWAQTMEKAL